MIIFKGGGRLGNQIFQYLFLKNFAKRRAILVTFNFKEFNELFVSKDLILNIENVNMIKIFDKYITPFLEKLLKKGMTSSVVIKRTTEKGFSLEGRTYTHKKGFLPITVVGFGYFQSEKMFKKKSLKDFKIKRKYIKRANEYLENNVPEGYKKIFIHIRRGDYVNLGNHPLNRKDFTLPLSYYKKAVNELLTKDRDIFFIVLSDDIEYAKSKFAFLENKVFSENDMFTDFTIMTLCSGGIIANSSFSWWGAYLCKGQRKDIIVPKYFLGFGEKVECPTNILSCFKNQIDI